MVWDANRRLLGRQGPDPEPRVPLERPSPPQRLVELQAGTRRRHRQPRHRRHRDDPGRHRTCSTRPARRPEHLVPRLQQHDQAVGRRQGPPGDRHGHRPRARSSRTSTRRARRSPTTSRRARSRSPARATRAGTFDPAAAKQLLDRGRLPGRLRDQDPVPRRGPRLRHRSAGRSRPRSRQQLKTNLGITATSRAARVGRHARRLRRRARSTGIEHDRLGRGLSGPLQLPRLPLRLGLGQEVRDPVPGHRRRAQRGRRDGRSGRPDRRLHDGQRPDQGARPGRSSSSTAPPAPRTRPTSRAPTPRSSAARSSPR